MYHNPILSPEYQYNQTNLHNTHLMIDQMFQLFSKVLVIRLDLSFQYDLAQTMNRDNAIWYLTKFRNNMRNNQLFNSMITYMAKLEYGLNKGWHFHVCFCFNGQQVQNDQYLAIQIGQYWCDIIVGQNLGLYFSCNSRQYDESGIGMIDYRDIDKINIFKTIMAYLCKIDETTLEQFTGLSKMPRTFFRGQLPQMPETKLGRPRLYDTSNLNDSNITL